MYTIVTMYLAQRSTRPVMELECYGPFNSKKEADRHAKALSERPNCLIFVEYLFGEVISDKDVA